VAIENARLLHAEATVAPTTPVDEHVAEFEKLWAGMDRRWLSELSDWERQKFDALKTDTLRDAFRIVRNWSCAEPDVFDFFIVARQLGDRLGVSLYWASNIRRQFCTAGIMRRTANYIAHKLACRYEWTANQSKRPTE